MPCFPRLLCLLFCAFFAASGLGAYAAVSGKAESGDESLFQALEWRSIGPYRGGRVTAVAGVNGQPRLYYMGATGGGIWTTADAGISWKPVADGQLATGSVGALAVAESDPNVIYAGMGESPIRGNASHGDGVYKSTDAGKTWTHVGLSDTRQIGRVRIHPQDPDRAYVAALGHIFGPNAERGIFRTTDGGKSWQKILYVDEKTGAIDLAMDPSNPRVLYAGFWQVARTPWSLESGGPGSSLHKSTDGGDSWTKLEGAGLPEGIWGKLGIAVSPAKPERVWAIVEAEDGGIFRSDDAGKTWRRTNDERKLRQRAWYYTRIYADPASPETVYVLNVRFWRSTDGGKSFTAIRTPHGDNHDLWIAPDDPLRMVEGNDGGANVSFDGGASWSRQDNQPTAQFYHVITDDRFPYSVYGAQQDNSTVAIPSRTSGSGIDIPDWHQVGGCESGYIAPRPDDPDIVYAGCYGGTITRYDHRTGQERDITVYPDNPMGWGADGMKYRFQWTFPIVVSPHDPDTLYAAGNVLFKSTNEGQSWRAISPDLTRNDPSKLGPSGGPITKDNTSIEYYCTIFAFAESRLEKGLLWAGSDDGLVHLSRDGGQNWSDVTPKQLPEWSLVSQIDPSPHDPATAYLAVNRYKLDDYRPYVYVTHDHGESWKQITEGIPETAFVRVVREDPDRKGLLYAGTETGVFVSLDGGSHWQSLQRNLPVVPITDLVVKNGDVIVSTQGRSFWILDDVSPLHEHAEAIASQPAHLFVPRPAYRFGGSDRPRPGVGANPPNGAIVYYHLANEPGEEDEVTLEFLDETGGLIKSFSSLKEAKPAQPDFLAESLGVPARSTKLPVKAGLNRFVWDLRHADASTFEGLIMWAGRVEGPKVVPGTYQARLNVGGESLTQRFEILKDSRLEVTQEELQAQLDLLLKIRNELTQAHDAIVRLRAVQDQIGSTLERSSQTPDADAIAAAAEALTQKLTAVEEALYQTKNRSRQDPLNFPIRLNNKLAALAGVVASADAAPTQQAHAVYDDLSSHIDAELARLEEILQSDLPAFNELVREKNVPAVVVKEEAGS